MCKLSDKDLRMAGNRNMTDLMWSAVKEPLETHFTFDKDGLDLAFKYFTCSTLTIRLAGIAQLNVSWLYFTIELEEVSIAKKSLTEYLCVTDVLFGEKTAVETVEQNSNWGLAYCSCGYLSVFYLSYILIRIVRYCEYILP